MISISPSSIVRKIIDKDLNFFQRAFDCCGLTHRSDLCTGPDSSLPALCYSALDDSTGAPLCLRYAALPEAISGCATVHLLNYMVLWGFMVVVIQLRAQSPPTADLQDSATDNVL